MRSLIAVPRVLLGLVLLALTVALTACSENYAKGERIGVVTQFSQAGVVWKTHEGHLNMTQTGMNSSQAFDFSVDRDAEDATVVAMLDSAANEGWKVKLEYHQVQGWNWFENRGETNHFITKVEVLDRTFSRELTAFRQGGTAGGAPERAQGAGPACGAASAPTGRVVDTVVVLVVGRASEGYHLGGTTSGSASSLNAAVRPR